MSIADLNVSLEAIRHVVQARGWERITLCVRADGRVHIAAEDNGYSTWWAEADLHDDSAIYTPEAAFEELASGRVDRVRGPHKKNANGERL